jgi:diacylglycerol O-acyltransferase
MTPIAPTDAIFLLGERREQPMHVGGLELFRLPEGARRDWIQKLYSQVVGWPEVAPMFRRRAVRPVSALGLWSWQEDDSVDLEHHVRHSALPAPGRVRELLALVSRLHGTLMDRHRPLWEVHLIEGLEGRRFAMYTKVHHSLVDGVSALRFLEHALSPDPSERGMAPLFAVSPPGRDSAARAAGAGAEADNKSDAAHSGFNGSTELRAPRTILNAPITGARRFAAQSWPLERVRAVSKATGTTINDVVLAMCSAALRSYLSSLGALPEAPLVAMTPVSLRKAGSAVGGNAVGTVLCNLGTHLEDPGEGLKLIHASMEEGKEYLRSLSPLQAGLASALALMPVAVAMVPGLRRGVSPGYNLVISNVPGPQYPLYYNGAQMEGLYPLSIVTDGQALNITVTSYNGSIDFGLTGCRRTVPHLQRLLGHLDEALSGLEVAAGV